MTSLRFKLFAAVLPCLAIALSASVEAAERVAPTQREANDVALQADGVLVGRLVSAEGRAIDGAVVTLSQNDAVIGQTTTDAEGIYRFVDRSAGVYRITAGNTTRDFRVWPAQAAPPGAQSYATIVESTQVVRGQLGGGNIGTILGVAGGITGITLGAIAIDKANDAEDEAAALRALLNSMSP